MSDPRTLQPGPWVKSPAWRGGAFLLGFAFLLIIVDWLLGNFVDIGAGRLMLVLAVGGVALSAPYGLGLARKPEPRFVPPRDFVPQAHVQAQSGSTYVIVAPPDAPPVAAPAIGPRAKVREFTPGWYALYTLLWRWPVLMGDYALTGLWRLVTRVRGTRVERPIRSLDFDRPDSLPQPDRETF